MKWMTRAFWGVTGLFAALMTLGALMDVAKTEEAVHIFQHLGYPEYLLPFLGFLKIAGSMALLVPRVPKALKEWAYAGLVFDMSGALYSHLSVGDSASEWLPAVIGLFLVGGSYVLATRRERLRVQLDEVGRMPREAMSAAPVS